jgi:hypothetical protein
MVFGPGKTMNWPKNDCSRAERSGIDPVLRPGLSLAQLQPGLDGAGPQLVVVNLKHRWPMLLSEKLWSFSVLFNATFLFVVAGCCDGSLSQPWDRLMAVDEPSDRTWAIGSQPSECGKLLIHCQITFDRTGKC